MGEILLEIGLRVAIEKLAKKKKKEAETSRDGCREGWGKQEVSTPPPTPCCKYPQLLSFELPPHHSLESSLCSSLR